MLSTLYPTDTSANLYYADDAELTAFVHNLPGISFGDDVAKSYYMGYLPQDTFPETCFGLTFPYLSNDNKTLTLNNFVKENRPWGFCWLYKSGSAYAPMMAYYYDNAHQMQKYTSNDDYWFRFINKIKMANISMVDEVQLKIYFRIVDSADLDENGTGKCKTTVQYQWNTNLAGLRDFVSGDSSLTCSIPNSYVSNTKVINYSDFENDALTFHYTEGSYEVYVQLQDYTLYCSGKYNHEGSFNNYGEIIPFFRTHLADGYGLPEQDIVMTGYPQQGSVTQLSFESDNDTHTTFLARSNGLPYIDYTSSGTIGTNIIKAKYPIDTINFDEVPILTGSGHGIIKHSMFINAISGSGLTFRFMPVIDFKDVLKVMMIRNCIQTGITSPSSLVLQNTYTSGNYVSYFDTDDIPYYNSEPVSDWGAVGDVALLSDILRPWQLPNADITENDFDVDDMPEYNPPGPEPSEWGDDRYGTVPGLWLGSDGITANFITPWVLRGSQVTNFGQFLWENLFLPDPDDPSVIDGLWKNFKDALGTYWQTGSFDPASTLDYVISLLYFPFDLTSNSSDTSTKKIYFGTGALGLTVSSTYNTRKLSTYHGYLNGGGLDLTDASVKSALGIPDDFRGLANTSACIYLPFCGTYQVNWADIRDSALGITYAIDFTTGSCIAYVVSTKNGKSTYVLTASGMVGFSVPLSATNANRLISSILGDVAQSGTKFLDMGTNIGTKIMTGGQADKPSQISGGESDDIGNAMTISAAGGPLAGPAIGGFNVVGSATKELFSKPSIGIPTMSGGSGWSALHCPRTPYLQVRTPQYVPDSGHGHAFGWPAEKHSATIAALPTPDGSNYYECINVDTSSLTCTHEEREMIKRQLENGFYIKGA